MTPSSIITVLQIASTVGLAFTAALAARDWFATRDRSHLWLVLAIGSLAAVSLLGRVATFLGGWFTGLSSHVTIVLFLASGLALLLFRDSVIPLSWLTRRLVTAAVAATALLEILIRDLAGKAAPRPLQLLSLVAFVVVWCGCVGEPTVRLWLAARGRSAVQRARMRALSYGYMAIIAILLAAVFSASFGPNPVVQIAFALAGVGIVPLLYAGFAPPAWLRRAWRQGEESKLQAATQDLVLFSADRATLAGRALDWAVRLTGADSGFFVGSQNTVISSTVLTAREARELQLRIGTVARERVIPLGGSPRRNAIVLPIPGSDASIVLLGGPFTPIFGTDEQAWIRQYASLVGTGLERVRLVETLEGVNDQLKARVAEVTERTAELEAANKELEAFSYTISHDLRAPLRAINGFTSILMEDYVDTIPEEAKDYLKRVKDNGEHMGRLVDDLLAFSRLGRQNLRKQTVNMRTLVDRVLEQLADSIQGRKIEVVKGDLPGCEADPSLLEQVYVNLLSNAVKYSQKKESARVEVGSIKETAERPTVYFVRDNGAGFDMAYSDKLFGVFQRLHRDVDYQGTGVGLAIVKRIVERHGGRVWADGKVDQGATFYFTLTGGNEWQKKAA